MRIVCKQSARRQEVKPHDNTTRDRVRFAKKRHMDHPEEEIQSRKSEDMKSAAMDKHNQKKKSLPVPNIKGNFPNSLRGVHSIQVQ